MYFVCFKFNDFFTQDILEQNKKKNIRYPGLKTGQINFQPKIREVLLPLGIF